MLQRRSLALLALGRHAAALDDARHAVAVLRRAGDTLWVRRAMMARGLINHAMGFAARADADFAAAERLLAETNQVLESIYMVHNRALVAFALNDIPAALAYFDEAAARYEPLNVMVSEFAIDRCVTLLAAGLARDALAEADAAVHRNRTAARPGDEEGRTAADRGQCRAGRGPATDCGGPGPGRVPAVPGAAEQRVSGPDQARAGPREVPDGSGVAPVAA